MEVEVFMRAAIAEAESGLQEGAGGPFGCVIVRHGEIVGRGRNRVPSTHDPTAHAEMVAIRAACAALQSFRLDDCELYASCEPCPMCLAAIYWAHIPRVYYGNSRAEAAAIGFDDDFIYRQISLAPERRTVVMRQLLPTEAHGAFQAWRDTADRVCY